MIRAPRGNIYDEQKYIHAKMLDHSWWHGVLPRNITPSDIDMWIELSGFFFYFELSSTTSELLSLPKKGQVIGYKNLWKSSAKNIVLICKHSVSASDRQIRTPTDFESVGVYFRQSESAQLSTSEFLNFCISLGKAGPAGTLDRLQSFH